MSTVADTHAARNCVARKSATDPISPGVRAPLDRRPHVGMLDRPVNQDGCKASTLTIGYAASGTVA